MAEQQWDFGAIESAIGDLHKEHDSLHSLLETQRASVQLVNSDAWHGPAREGWQNAEKAWSDKADAAVEALNKLISSIQTAHDSMQSAENSLKGKFA